MSDDTFRCARCGKPIVRSTDEPGSLVQCETCKSFVVVPGLTGEVSPPPGPSFRTPDEKRLLPLWVFFGIVFVLCALAVGLIFFFIQRGSHNQADFTAALQAAENVETPQEGVRIVEQLLLQNRFDAGQRSQARTLRALLWKRMQVDAAVAEAKREEAARQAIAAAKPRPAPPPSAPELTLVDAQAVYEKGVHLACGNGVAKDEAEAFRLVSKASGIGLPEAQHDLAAMYAEGIGCASNLTAALLWGHKAAEHGDAEAQAWLGYLYANAKDVSADPVQAAQWNEKAAAQGQAEAAFNLGLQYVNGQGVHQDCASAFHQFSTAAAGGNAEAQANLGVLYWKGLGVEQDPTNAFRCFQRAQELGCVQGTFALSLLYGIGGGVAKDRQMAFACCLSAARSGHVGAQKQLGRMFITGNGVPWSEQDAIYWYRLAAAQGDESARQAVAAYRNTHVPPVLATCEACLGKGMVVRTCPECHGAGTLTETATSKSIKNCVCGWQMVNGRCPNCGRTDNSGTRTLTVPCAACHGTGRQNVPCNRCGGMGQVRVSGPAQTSFAQMISRPDPGIALTTSAGYTPVRLHPFRTGVNRGGGL